MIPASALAAMPAAMQAAAAQAAQAQPQALKPALPGATPATGRYAPEGPGIGGAVVALLLVLALIVGLAWLLKRMPGSGFRQAEGLRVVASIPLGARERAAVVQVGGEQLLLGIGAGGVRTLHRLAEPLPTADAGRGAAAGFPDFRQVLAQRLRRDR